jgi:hypothetical protein
VAYWAEGSGTSSEVDRYSCTLDSTTHLSSSPVKAAVASAPPASGLGVGKTSETITVSTEIDPSQFSTGAQYGWTGTGAFTTAQGYASGTLTVGSNLGFTSGPITLTNSAGSQQLTGCTVPLPSTSTTTFTGCSAPSGTVTNGTFVTQSSVSSVQISVAQPATSYTYNLVAAPRSTTPQSFTSANLPNLLTLGAGGVDPVHGGGNASCPDNVRADVCIGDTPGAVVVDSAGTVYCTGGGVHNYIHFKNSGSVETTAPESSSSCNSVSVTGSVPSVPDPLLGQLPNNGCFPSSLAGTMILDPSADARGNAVPGVYDFPLDGSLEPGIYILEDGLGTVSMAPSGDPSYGSDPSSGVLFFIPGPSSSYPASQGCFTDSTYSTGHSPTALSGTVNGVVPLDSTQAAAAFSGNTSLAGVWAWQDAFNTNDVTVTGYSAPAPGSTSGGTLYAPQANYGTGPLSTGSMVIGGVTDNGGHLKLCLSWTYSSSC